jgi:hypothetical protein
VKREIQDKLDKVFEKKRQAETAAAAAKSAQEKKEEEAVLKFKEIRESMIRPTMQQFADYLGNKGHAAEILMEEEKYEGSGVNRRLVAPSIRLVISPNSSAPQQYASYTQNPHFDVILEKSLSKVWFHESTMRASGGGHAGKCGEADLDKLTGDTLEPLITKIISNVFG